MGVNKETRVTEHINMEWVVQATEQDIFSWLQTCFRQKETYIYHDDKFVLILSYQNLTPEKKIKLEQIKNDLRL
jgi:hypothetical protein